MAALCWREFNGRRPGSRESTAFVAVDVDDIDRLAPMFQSIRTRLPHVSAWVIEADLLIQVIEGKPRIEGTPASEHRPTPGRTDFEPKHPVPHRTPPTLRIARAAATEDAAIEDAAIEGAAIESARSPHASNPVPAGRFDESSPDGDDFNDEPSAVRLTREEIAMLMGDLDEPTGDGSVGPAADDRGRNRDRDDPSPGAGRPR